MKNTTLYLIIATAVTLLTMILFHSNFWSALIIGITSYYLFRYLLEALNKNSSTGNAVIAVLAGLAFFIIILSSKALTVCGVLTLIAGAADIYLAYSKK